MKAIILAAGLGSRLKDLTTSKPKALVEVNGKTMLEIVITKLRDQGITDFLINIHHFGESIIEFLKTKNNFGVNITISDERMQLLDTGGAILKAQNFIRGDEPVLIHNVDIISDVKVSDILKYHNLNNSIATLCVRKRDSGRGLLFNKNMQLVGWTNIEKHQFKWVNKSYTEYNIFAYSGIYLISPKFTNEIKQTGKFSIIDTWLEMANNNIISGFVDTSSTWHDLGTHEKISNAESKKVIY
ncbi:MAG: sugar phosphate nucleotidyltransferase [Bacteroidota bacterium]